MKAPFPLLRFFMTSLVLLLLASRWKHRLILVWSNKLAKIKQRFEPIYFINSDVTLWSIKLNYVESNLLPTGCLLFLKAQTFLCLK